MSSLRHRGVGKKAARKGNVTNVSDTKMGTNVSFFRMFFVKVFVFIFSAVFGLLLLLALALIITPLAIKVWNNVYLKDIELELKLQAIKGLDGMRIEDIPPVTTKFVLRDHIPNNQTAFMRMYGFIQFEGVMNEEEVDMFRSERKRMENHHVEQNTESIHGVPLFKGTCDSGEKLKCIHRIPFGSLQSQKVKALIHDERFGPIKDLVQNFGGGESVRIGDLEKDGVVFNSYVNHGESKGWSRAQLGWHTDGLRDIAYLRIPKPMLNVGMHLDTVDQKNGDAALCLLPSTHLQSFLGFCFRKIYFISTEKDADEICVSTNAGDVTVHDGRLWHRVEPSKKTGTASLRRTVYVPYLTSDQPVEIKSKDSTTPFYHYIGMFMRYLKGGK